MMQPGGRVPVFEDVVDTEVAFAVAEAQKKLLAGQAAHHELQRLESVKFFTSRAQQYVHALMNIDPSETEKIRVLIVGLSVLRDHHAFLADAVTAGLDAAHSLTEQATKKENNGE